jgi:hypothetical protein
MIRVIFIVIVNLLIFSACTTEPQKKPNDEMPKFILWTWERPEDLRFLDARKYGAAFLAQTLTLRHDIVLPNLRRQPLLVGTDVYLIAVTRIETDKKQRPNLSDMQKEEIITFIKQTATLPNVKAVQIDFDVLVSERAFYKNLVFNLKKNLPENTPLTITALASWCAFDNWFADFPIEEAVPMAFRMGVDDQRIRRFLRDGGDWREPLCRKSYGIATDELLKMEFKRDRKIFIFNSRAWREEDLQNLSEGVLRQ